jgi:hypothetical protein
MPHVNFGTKDEPGFDLEESPDLIAVRTRSRRSIAAAALADGTMIAAFPDAGVEVFQVPAASLAECKRRLRAAPDVRFAGSALVHPGTKEPVLYTENIYVRFKEGVESDDCEAAIRTAGLTVRECLAHATNAYIAAAPEGTGQRIFDIALDLLSRDDVLYCHPELIQRSRRYAKV